MMEEEKGKVEEQASTEEKKEKEKSASAKVSEDKSASAKATADKAVKKPRKARKDTKELNDLKEQIADLNDKYLRLFSEFDNFRKRTLREKTELSKYASEDVINVLLPVLDDFDRAITSFEEAKVDKEFKQGVELIQNKLKTVLSQKGLEEMTSKGEEFNTDYHEAVTNIPAPSEDMKGKVVDEVEKGYLLNGKVIRYAKVVVGN
jgi:molecular chaperone GrpE